MATYAYHLRRSTRPGRHEGRMFIRIIHERKFKDITTEFMLYPDEWNANEQTIVMPGPGSARLRHLIDTEDKMAMELERVKNIVRGLEIRGYFTVTDIKKSLTVPPDSNVLAAYAELLREKLTENGQVRTARAYKTAANGLIAFSRQRGLRLDDISTSLIRRYEQWMKDHGKSMNTISFYMRNLRAIYHKAVEERVILARYDDPFRSVYTGIAVTRKRALTESEMKKVKALDPMLGMPAGKGGKGDRKPRIRLKGELRDAYAYFMFSFYTMGMSSIDVAYLRKSNLQGGTISYCRKKTGGNIEITVVPQIRIILDYFAARTADSPFLFPIIRPGEGEPRAQYENHLRKQNKRLKQLAKMAGVNKPLSTHWARHSWATIAKTEGAPAAKISEGLGHKDEKTTRIYLDSFGTPAIDKINELVSNAID